MNTKTMCAGLLFAALLVPALTSAHGTGMMGFNENYTTEQMMRYVEDEALGSDLHEEMEELMVAMMSGELTQAQAERMVALMQEYPGPYGMMMGRIGMMGGYGLQWGEQGEWGNHMSWGYGDYGMMGWFIPLTMFVWLIVGLLAIAWLVKRLSVK